MIHATEFCFDGLAKATHSLDGSGTLHSSGFIELLSVLSCRVHKFNIRNID